MFIAVLEHESFARRDLRSLRTGMMAGAPCPVELMQKVIERMHMHQITIGYGMTETSPISMQSSIDDSIDNRVSTVGRILPHLEVKIVDEDGRARIGALDHEPADAGAEVLRGAVHLPGGLGRQVGEVAAQRLDVVAAGNVL